MIKEYIVKSTGLLKANTPLIFADGTSIYNKLSEKYIVHKAGLFILAPSGAGKTHYVENQKKPHWIDGDEIWMAAKAHPEGSWWLKSIPVIEEIDQRSDVITAEAKKLGFWIMGASNYWLRPDAVVIPDWGTHQKYILHREKNNYDGGATSKNYDRLKSSRTWMSRWKKEGVPIFQSIEQAVENLVKKI
jgi:hypothetical protein